MAGRLGAIRLPSFADDARLAELLAAKTRNGMDRFTPEWWPAAEMTVERARWVRRLRCDEENTWRGVASACAEEWGDHPNGAHSYAGNQIAGMEICDLAAALLGENYLAEPWN